MWRLGRRVSGDPTIRYLGLPNRVCGTTLADDRRHPTPLLRNESPSFVCLHPSPHNRNMAPSPTPNAPRTLAELADLLKDDEMVKVAGELAPFEMPNSDPRRRRGRSSSRQDHVQEQVSFGCRVFLRVLRRSIWMGQCVSSRKTTKNDAFAV